MLFYERLDLRLENVGQSQNVRRIYFCYKTPYLIRVEFREASCDSVDEISRVVGTRTGVFEKVYKFIIAFLPIILILGPREKRVPSSFKIKNIFVTVYSADKIIFIDAGYELHKSFGIRCLNPLVAVLPAVRYNT